jgi:cyclopropane-fatty-acyl-phospholipid synthase
VIADEDQRSEPAERPQQIHLRPPTLYWATRILLKPDVMLGQTYVDERWDVPPDELYDFLYLIRSKNASRLQKWFLLSNKIHPVRDLFKQRLFPIRSTRAVAEHYNTNPDFIALVLGPSLSYTCAFFDDSISSLEAAQQRKIDTIAERLSLSRGMNVLDVGSGWGYAAFPIAERYECSVTGITISDVQVQFCEQRKPRSAAADRLTFLNVDYARFEPSHKFDRVISVGMLEHVGKYQYPFFFNRISEFLHDDGVALIHCIVTEEESSPDAWIDKYIFPGGYIPTMSEVTRGIEQSHSQLIQAYTHPMTYYFKTLERWMDNLVENDNECRRKLREQGLELRDVTAIMRIWAYFLASSKISFSNSFGKCRVAQFIVRKQT